jgi:heme/copper-type cytochrome/quinol oxidase subunit 2
MVWLVVGVPSWSMLMKMILARPLMNYPRPLGMQGIAGHVVSLVVSLCSLFWIVFVSFYYFFWSSVQVRSL